MAMPNSCRDKRNRFPNNLNPIVPVGTSLGISLGKFVGASVGTSLGISLGKSVGASVGTSLGASVGTSLGVSLSLCPAECMAMVGSGSGSDLGGGGGDCVLGRFWPWPEEVVASGSSSLAGFTVGAIVDGGGGVLCRFFCRRYV
ncbi:putative uncharacterized protein YER190C-A [Manihot esculenta]|uniref:putative uncharacterized protein YER190C-A n=1 Tax=Manihot esculenta TaxID=3983 RepID=UPI001CC7A53B|nr:putative uncharacterized protein YER190C-A [Manihot esculenta]